MHLAIHVFKSMPVWLIYVSKRGSLLQNKSVITGTFVRRTGMGYVVLEIDFQTDIRNDNNLFNLSKLWLNTIFHFDKKKPLGSIFVETTSREYAIMQYLHISTKVWEEK